MSQLRSGSYKGRTYGVETYGISSRDESERVKLVFLDGPKKGQGFWADAVHVVDSDPELRRKAIAAAHSKKGGEHPNAPAERPPARQQTIFGPDPDEGRRRGDRYPPTLAAPRNRDREISGIVAKLRTALAGHDLTEEAAEIGEALSRAFPDIMRAVTGSSQ